MSARWIIKRIFLAAIVVGASTSFAADIGRPLSLQSSAESKPGMTYSYDMARPNQSTLSWSLTFNSTLSLADISSLPKVIGWAFFNEATSQYASGWWTIQRESLISGTIGTGDTKSLKVVLPNLKFYDVVFATSDGTGKILPLYFIPIGSFCGNDIASISDLTNPGKAACSVRTSELPDDGSAFCAGRRAIDLERVSKQLLTCSIAKRSYANDGCGVLDCN